MKTATTNQRDSNIEMLRLVVMGMIVLHHFIFHGLGVFRNIQFGENPVLNASDTKYALIADSFLIYGVNVFVLISGFFSIKLKSKSFIKLFAICSFFAILGYSIYLLKSGEWGGGIVEVLHYVKRGLFVISSRTWWFVQLYFLLMFLSGPINKYIEISTRKSLQLSILVFVFINVYLGWIHGVEFVKDGYNIFNFIMLYLIGRYLKLYWKNDYKSYKDLVVFIAASVATTTITLLCNKMGWNVFWALSYNSPFIIIGAISLLLFFTKMNFTSKIINYLATSSLAIYLFQDGCFNFYLYIKQMYLNNTSEGLFLLMILVFFVLSMIIPIAIDKLRLLLFGQIEEKVIRLLDDKLVKRYLEKDEK